MQVYPVPRSCLREDVKIDAKFIEILLNKIFTMQIISGPHPGSTRALVEEDLWSHTEVIKIKFHIERRP